MAEHQNFRTALAGFNREDVVRYIEYLNTTHAAEIAQLNSELEYLRSREMSAVQTDIASEETVEAQEREFRDTLVAGIEEEQPVEEESAAETEALESLKAEVEAQNAEIEALKAEVDAKNAGIEALKAEADAKTAEIRTLQAAAEEKDAQLQILISQNEDLRSQQEANANLMEKELETYRRAERVERKARERAELVYYRVNGTLSEATGKVEDAAKLIGEMTERVTAQLNELQTAVTGSKEALAYAADTMVALRPEPEE